MITYNIFFIVWTLGRKKTHTYKLTLHKHGNNTETGPQRTPTPTANTTLNDWRVSAVLSGGARRGKWSRARVLRDGMGSFSFFSPRNHFPLFLQNLLLRIDILMFYYCWRNEALPSVDAYYLRYPSQ